MNPLKDLPGNIRERFSAIALVWISFVISMGKPWESLLQAWDSALHARIALQVSSGGLLPVLPGRWANLDLPSAIYNDHPFPLFYLSGKFMRLFGANAWSARFIPSLFGVLSVWLLYRIVKKQFHHGVALLASLLFLLTPMWFQNTARFQLDPAMIFWILLSFGLWREVHADPQRVRTGHALLAGLSAGMAAAFKTPVGFLILPVALLTDLVLSRNRTRKPWIPWLVLAAASLLPPLLVWKIAADAGGIGLVRDYFERQVLGTAVGGRGIGSSRDYFYFWGVLRLSWLPGLLLGALSLAALLILRLKARMPLATPWGRDLKLHAAATGVLVVTLSCLRFKYPYYFLPVFPFVSVLVACIVDAAFRAAGRNFNGRTLDSLLIPAGFALPLLLVILPVQLTAEQFPALRKFIPYIQTRSAPSDRVLYINHAQPYGNGGDAYPEIAFYTGLTFASSPCEAAPPKIAGLQPEWIITSGKSAADCIPADLLKSYPLRLKAGNQFLLSRHVPESREDGAFDLTPLYRELEATVDRDPPPLPATPFYKYE